MSRAVSITFVDGKKIVRFESINKVSLISTKLGSEMIRSEGTGGIVRFGLSAFSASRRTWLWPRYR